jgi:hypothetical protein
MNEPKIYNSLVAEIQMAVKEGNLPSEGNISWTEAQGLPYFQACLKEAMRVRPAVGLNITRLVPPEGAELDGEFFKGGTRIAVNGWVLHLDKPTFGQDAEKYRPERWLEDAERSRRMERYMFQVRRTNSRGVTYLTDSVWRRCPRLYWEKPRPPRDQQGHSPPDPRLPYPAGPPRSTSKGKFHLFCCPGRVGGVHREEEVVLGARGFGGTYSLYGDLPGGTSSTLQLDMCSNPNCTAVAVICNRALRDVLSGPGLITSTRPSSCDI